VGREPLAGNMPRVALVAQDSTTKVKGIGQDASGSSWSIVSPQSDGHTSSNRPSSGGSSARTGGEHTYFMFVP